VSRTHSYRTARPRVHWSATGVSLGALAYLESLRPSLLARSTTTQIAVSTLALVTGYGLGAGVGAIARAVVRGGGYPRPSAPTRHWLLAFLVGLPVAVALAATSYRLGWQAAQASVDGLADTPNAWLTTAGTLLLSTLVVLAARGLRWASRRVGHRYSRHLASRALSNALGGVTIAAAVICAVVMATWFLGVRGEPSAAQAGAVPPPTSFLRSGGPGSEADFASLGAQGRRYVTGGPGAVDIDAVLGISNAVEPIRVYVGMQSAGTTGARVALAVRELERTGAFSRPAIVVITANGDGSVDPVAADSLEYVLHGDVASVTVQYSTAPSWSAFLGDHAAAADAGVALLEAVDAKVATLPGDERPKVYAYGQGLGAYGSQSPFADHGVAGIARRSDGALWVGPPHASRLRSQLVARSHEGPPWAPIVQHGSVVRFAADADGLAVPASTWGTVRAAYLQQTTDPVVYFAVPLLWSRPDWLDERGPGVPTQMSWRPLLTFYQVAADLLSADRVPPGQGHDYADSITQAWVDVLQPSDWTSTQTDAVRQAVT